VLQPLSEIAPDFTLPGQSMSVSELLQNLPPDPGMKIVKGLTIADRRRI